MMNQPELKHQPRVRICLKATKKSKDSASFNVKSYGKIILTSGRTLMLKNSPILSIWELREDGSHHKF
jgi:hypothetical protein